MRFVFVLISILVVACTAQQKASNMNSSAFQTKVKEVLRNDILEKAAWALQQQPVTVTQAYSPRSAGGKHDFFSEGDYWWPNPLSCR